MSRVPPPASTALHRHLIERIVATGPITFAEFVATALYHPEHGYYLGGGAGIGREGDFLTAPETHPIFGALIARQVAHLAGLTAETGSVDVIELGAGTGALARSLLDALAADAPAIYARTDYRIVEISPFLRDRQAAALAVHADRVAWVALDDLPVRSVRGVVLANEFFDALPFHRVVQAGGRLREIYVDVEAGDLVDRVGDLSTPELAASFDRLGRWPPEGGQVEVSLAGLAALERIAAALDRGAIVAIDYGYLVDEWLGRVRPRGTFLAHYRHTTNDEPYRRIGQQDLTAHVDFTGLSRHAARLGLTPLGPIDQRSYLIALGLPAWAAALDRAPVPPAERRRNLDALATLVDPAGMGKFLVLTLVRGLPDLTLDRAIGLPPPAPDPATVPRLPAAEPPADPFAAIWREAFGDAPEKP